MIACAAVAETAEQDRPGEAGQHPLVGQIIGERYRIDALLGEGGMGAVFRATHLGLGRPVAVKVLHPRLSDDDHIAKRFDREALAVSKLDHPNCVQVIDFGTTRKGMKYLVMQLLEGKELRDLTGVALPIEQVVYLGLQVLRALEHAHKRGLVHRDLKPENIFIVQDDDGNEVVKLVDFGIVKLLEDAPAERLTRMGMAFGTPTYMSPEQAAGGTIDARTDLYAVGVMLYELLTGVPPFQADEPGILMRMQILSDPPPLPETVPKAVADLVLRLLAKEPPDRYPDAREARRALAAAYKLPSKITGVVGLAAIASDEPTGPVVLEPLAAAGASPAEVHAQRAPTSSQDAAETRAEPASGEGAELFVRSGGTVLAPPTSAASSSHGSMPIPGPVHAAASSHGSMPIPGPVHAGSSHGGMPIPGPVHAGSSHGGMPILASPYGAAASLSHGAVPIAPASGSPPSFDPMAVSSPGLPVLGPGAYASGAHPRSGSSAAMSAPGMRRGSGPRTSTIVVVVLLLLVWFLWIAWWASRDDEQPAPPSPPSPSPAPAADGLYRFAEELSAGTPEPARPPAAEGKKPKTIKKPKRDDDD
jgi:serine/threonine protein kinase